MPESSRRTRFLDVGEIQTLLHAADGKLRPLIQLAIHTGLRKTEICGLTWDDIDMKRGLLHVTGKGGKTRVVPLSRTAQALLSHTPRRVDSQYVFAAPDGGRWNFYNRFQATLKRAGIKDCTFHTLRHTFASHLVMSGTDLLSVKELLGHSNLDMVLRYAHLAPDFKRAAIDRLDTYMDTSQNDKPNVSL